MSGTATNVLTGRGGFPRSDSWPVGRDSRPSRCSALAAPAGIISPHSEALGDATPPSLPFWKRGATKAINKCPAAMEWYCVDRGCLSTLPLPWRRRPAPTPSTIDNGPPPLVPPHAEARAWKMVSTLRPVKGAVKVLKTRFIFTW